MKSPANVFVCRVPTDVLWKVRSGGKDVDIEDAAGNMDRAIALLGETRYIATHIVSNLVIPYYIYIYIFIPKTN